MRIAISGTHSMGKSTFIQDFLQAHPEYRHEEEPYRALCNLYDIAFGKEMTRYGNGIQFYYHLSRIKQYTKPSDCVIFDRSPVDYLAYSLYAAKYHQTDLDMAFVESLIQPTLEALEFIDLLVFMPITAEHPIALEDDNIRPVNEDYRFEADENFKKIYRDKVYNLFPSASCKLIELWGDRQARLHKIQPFLR